MTGQVYVIGSPGSRTVKIGYSKAPQKRLWSLQVGSPVPLALLETFEGGRDLESALHRYFRSCWKQGEWFELGDAPVEDVRVAAALGVERLLHLPPRRPTERLRAQCWDDRFLPLPRGRAHDLLTKLDIIAGPVSAEEPVFHQCQDLACVDCRAGRPAFLTDPGFVVHEANWDAVPWEAHFQPQQRTRAATA
ncbi:GIY-YIG nuclease family protein [Streptomyces sp. NPDC090994]|uniref:GIY-YIG nuclease family protein n=1 Tax=Streptomyces sp. NPDC090994 TaxID=3365969 RepID=UPI003826C6BB